MIVSAEQTRDSAPLTGGLHERESVAVPGTPLDQKNRDAGLGVAPAPCQLMHQHHAARARAHHDEGEGGGRGGGVFHEHKCRRTSWLSEFGRKIRLVRQDYSTTQVFAATFTCAIV